MLIYLFGKQKKKIDAEPVANKDEYSVIYDKCVEAIKESLEKIIEPDEKSQNLIEEYVQVLSDKLDVYIGKEAESKRISAENKIIIGFLELYDTFKIIKNKIDNDKSADVTELLSKFEMSFKNKIKRTGTELIITDSVGKKIDYDNMEIVEVKRGTELVEDTVLEEIDSGYYVRNGRTIREQRVIVAGGKKK